MLNKYQKLAQSESDFILQELKQKEKEGIDITQYDYKRYGQAKMREFKDRIKGIFKRG